MTKRQPYDLAQLLTEEAAPMILHAAPAVAAEPATDLSASSRRKPKAAARTAARPEIVRDRVPAHELVNLSFKVSRGFRQRFRLRAVQAEIEQVELLAQAFEAWEAARKP